MNLKAWTDLNKSKPKSDADYRPKYDGGEEASKDQDSGSGADVTIPIFPIFPYFFPIFCDFSNNHF
jgi:hypothetical protein